MMCDNMQPPVCYRTECFHCPWNPPAPPTHPRTYLWESWISLPFPQFCLFQCQAIESIEHVAFSDWFLPLRSVCLLHVFLWLDSFCVVRTSTLLAYQSEKCYPMPRRTLAGLDIRDAPTGPGIHLTWHRLINVWWARTEERWEPGLWSP